MERISYGMPTYRLPSGRPFHFAAWKHHLGLHAVPVFTGAGLTGTVDGRQARLGRPGWIDAAELSEPVTAMQEAGATAVLI